jgi:hypothetical protein
MAFVSYVTGGEGFMNNCGSSTGCQVHDDKTYLGMRVVSLENKYVRVSIFPEYGGKIFEFVYKPLDHNFIWENERIKSRRAYYGANYDNFSTGGIEEAFPTGLPSTYKGEEIPFFGEVWSVPWDYSILCRSHEMVSVKLECFCSIYPVKIEKLISLANDGLSVEIEYRLINLSGLELDYIWGIHPSVSINPNCRINIPQTNYNINVMSPGEWRGYSVNTDGKKFTWPYLGNNDLTKVMESDENIVLSIYSDCLSEGWLNVFDDSNKIGFGMYFDPEIFKILSIWLIYGGWRGHYCLMFEPFTSWPLALDKAVEAGNAVRMKPRETIETKIKYFITESYNI